MRNYTQKVKETAIFLKSKADIKPEIGMLTGTGLGDSVRQITIAYDDYYQNIPNFPDPTAPSHAGRLLIGVMGNTPVIAMQGRYHLYEGYSPLDVTFPIRVLQEMGVTYLFLTNAAGGINPTFSEGDIMIIRDHINLTGENPLIGVNFDKWGVRFPDMTQAYDKQLILFAETAGKRAGILLKKGTYAGLKGPSLETPAEIRFLKTIGAEAVGFSTVMEVIAAVHAGMKVLGLSSITNVHDPVQPTPGCIDDIIAAANKTAPKIETILHQVIQEIEAHEQT